MKYKNAGNVFPDELIIEIRKYVSEGFIYVPCLEKRKNLDTVTDWKAKLQVRNQLIRLEYNQGKTVDKIANEQYLAKSTIYRILKEFNI